MKFENEIITGDCLEVLKGVPDNSIDLLVTDPPYGLKFMGRKWDKAVPPVEVWVECLRVLQPGAFAFIFSSPRQDVLSRMIINLGDAGFKTDFTSIYWTYANGLSKAANISKMVDKRGGKNLSWFIDYVLKVAEERGVTKKELTMLFPSKSGKPTGWLWNKQHTQSITLEQYNKIKDYLELPFETIEEAEREVIDRIPMTIGIGGNSKRMGNEKVIDKSATDEAKALDASYAGFQPRPAVEVILVCMKLLSEKNYVDQALENGKGITWLMPDCGIPVDGRSQRRFPSNLLCSDDALNDGKMRTSGYMNQMVKESEGHIYGKRYAKHTETIGDSGSFSRFFDLDAWFSEKFKQLPESVRKTFPFLIVPKSSKAERTANGQINNNHIAVKPIALCCYLITLGSRMGDIVLDPFAGTCTTALAARILQRKFLMIEIDEKYVETGKKGSKVRGRYLIKETLTSGCF